MIIEVACLGFFIFRTAHAFYFDSKSKFWRDAKNLMVIGGVVVSRELSFTVLASVYHSNVFALVRLINICLSLVCDNVFYYVWIAQPG